MIPAGRTFIRRMLATLRSSHTTRRIRLDSEFQADIAWWSKFASAWNGVSLLHDPFWSAPSARVEQSRPVLDMFTDACKTGFGAVLDTHWMHGRWLPQQIAAATRTADLSMPFLELLAIALAVHTWAPILRGRRLIIHSDCEGAVTALSQTYCRDPYLMSLIRTILFTAAHHEFALKLVHIAGSDNTVADALSRGQISTFETLWPNRNSGPTPTGQLPSHSW